MYTEIFSSFSGKIVHESFHSSTTIKVETSEGFPGSSLRNSHGDPKGKSWKKKPHEALGGMPGGFLWGILEKLPL